MSPFDDLKSRFEGKTVVSVEPPDADEAIAKFVMSDGTAFVLHATDLGYWMRATAAHPEGPYPSLTSMMEQYFQTSTRIPDFDTACATVTLNGSLLTLQSPDGKVTLRTALGDLSEHERKIAVSDVGRSFLGAAAAMGDAWPVVFSNRNPDCPRELWMPAQT